MFAAEGNLNNLSDEKLVEKVRTKNHQLYGEIVKRYQQKLYRYLRYLTNQPDEAEDLVQNVFIKAYRNLFGFDTKRKFSSWIYRIAHNEGVNHLKKMQKLKKVFFQDHNVLFSPVNNSPEDELIRQEIQKKMKECLDELKSKYREPLILYYFEDKSYQEISDVLKIPVGTVGTFISRGKLILKAICQKKGGDF